MKTIQRLFKSVNFAVEQAIQGESSLSEYNRASRSKSMPSWYGSASIEDVVDIHKNGWKEGGDVVRDLVKKYKDYFKQFLPEQNFESNFSPDFTGEIVDVSAYLNNIPECMKIYTETEETKAIRGNKLQRIIIENHCTCHIVTKTMLTRGGILAALVCNLDDSGFDTEIIISNKIILCNMYNIQYYTIIKQFGEQLDKLNLAFALAHPSWSRRIILSLQEQEESEISGKLDADQYGCPTNITKDEFNSLEKLINKQLGFGNIIFSQLNDNYTEQELITHTEKLVTEHFSSIKQGKINWDNFLFDKNTGFGIDFKNNRFTF